MARKRSPSNNRPGIAPSGPNGAPITPQVGPAGQGGGPKFGQKGQLEALASAGAQAPGGGGRPLPPNGLNMPTGGVFGPTKRPGEPTTAGAPFGPGPTPAGGQFTEGPEAVKVILTEAYRLSGDLTLLRLLEKF